LHRRDPLLDLSSVFQPAEQASGYTDHAVSHQEVFDLVRSRGHSWSLSGEGIGDACSIRLADMIEVPGIFVI
jgi:hypothetical protein